MKKSIFTRYLSAFLLIVFISFTSLALIVSSRTVKSSHDRSRIVANYTGTYISEYLVSEVEKLFPRSTALEQFIFQNNSDVSAMINLLSKNAEKMTIMITTSDGRILFCTDNLYSGKISDDGILEALTKDTKSEPFSELYSDIGGMLDSKYGLLVFPMKYEDNAYMGALIVCYSAGMLDELSESTIKTIILASLWVMIASFVAIYFISEKIVAPIKEMSVATKRFAAGEFDRKIPVEGSDEIAELATAFNSMADSLAKMEYMRSSFLANVAHDLRTPMTSISGFIDGIVDGAIPPEKQPYYLNLIAEEIRRLSRLVSNLLDLSRMEAGNRKFEKTPFDICETARIIILTFESKIDAKRLNVEFNAPDDRLYVFSDKDAIHQVLYNLCENAVKFSYDEGAYNITIKDAGGTVDVSVYNEGIGIAPEDLPHIFDRFYKSDKSRGLDRSGVGLGLYIVKSICDALGAQIKVESERGKYCKFTLTLPKYKGKLPPAGSDKTRN